MHPVQRLVELAEEGAAPALRHLEGVEDEQERGVAGDRADGLGEEVGDDRCVGQVPVDVALRAAPDGGRLAAQRHLRP